MFCNFQKSAGGTQTGGSIKVGGRSRLTEIAERNMTCQTNIGNKVMGSFFSNIQVGFILCIAIGKRKSIKDPGLSADQEEVSEYP